MGVDHCPGLVAAVDAKMQRQLGRGEQIAVDVLSVEVDHHDLLGRERCELAAGRSDRDQLSGPL